jgi:polyisoprenoid-binding protein YceI
MRRFTIATFVSTFLFSVAAMAATPYAIDKSHSSVGFKVKHMMISNVVGSFKDFDAVIEFDEKTKKVTRLEGTVIIDSIDTDIEKRDAHLKSDDFFAAAKHPTMTFVMTEATDDKVSGNLTIRGITKTVAFDLDFGGVATDPWGNERMGFELSGKINRKDFGLVWNKALETGGVLVGDDVRMTIAVEAIKK